MNIQKWYKIKYIGKSFGVDELTNGKIYCAIEDGTDMYRVVDDSEEDYLYDKINPQPSDGSSKGGKWEVVDTIECKELNSKLKYVSSIDEKLNKSFPIEELKKCISNTEMKSKNKIIDYLYTAPIVLMRNNIKEDVLDEDMGAIGTEIWRSDGVYKWSSSLIYYFNNYNLKLDDEFVKYILSK